MCETFFLTEMETLFTLLRMFPNTCTPNIYLHVFNYLLVYAIQCRLPLGRCLKLVSFLPVGFNLTCTSCALKCVMILYTTYMYVISML